jgi:ferredoxin-NADP reductase
LKLETGNWKLLTVTHPIHTARLCRSVHLSEQTSHLEFRVDYADEFPFQPGQFISVREPLIDGKQVTRAYSLASAPRNSCFDLCLNRIGEGRMSNFLCDLPEGGEIHFHGPHGLFTLREPLRDSMFLCTGTGIAPLRAMIQWLLADPLRHGGHQLWLVYGTRWETDIYYAAEFTQLERLHPNFHYLATLSRAGVSWAGLRGYVQDHARHIASARPNNGAGNMHAYICGLHTMVNDNRDMLLSLGWDKHDIIYERYD